MSATPSSGSPGKTRSVEVVDVRDVGVEDVEGLQHQAGFAGQSIAGFPIPQGRVPGAHAGVFDQRARAEMAYAKAAEYRLPRFDSQTRGNHAIQSTRHMRRRPGPRPEASMRQGQIGVDDEPRAERVRSSSTRCRRAGSGARPPSCPHRPRTAARSRGRDTTARRSTAVREPAPSADRSPHRARERAASRDRPTRRSPGRRVIVAPRASLLWKPTPAFAYTSVPAHGPKTAPNLGLTRPSEPSPEFSGLSEVDREAVPVGAQANRRAQACASTRSRSAQNALAIVWPT